MFKDVVRLLSFLVKEILDVLQQPRLVLTLILGPFLILFLFGLGFTGLQPPAEAIIVVPPGAELPAELMEYVKRFRKSLPIQEITDNREYALEILKAGQVDLVAVLPTETYSAFMAGQQIVIEVLINEFDPMRANWVTYVAAFFVTELNKELLARTVGQAKQLAPGLQRFSVDMLDDLIALGEDLEAGNLEQARARLEEILQRIADEAGSLEASSQVLLGLESVLAMLGAPIEDLERLGRILGYVYEFRDELEQIRRELGYEEIDIGAQLERLKEVRNTIVELQTTAELLEQIPTDVLVSPLTTTVENVSLHKPDYVGFYSPAVLALLLQHIAVTFSSLTLVRERLLGAEEVFRVAPIAPWEIITGKYMSYSVLTMAIGAALSFLIVRLMGVPLFGSLTYFALVLVLLTISSLGWGFLISVFSTRESLSVQLSMLILIASVFFSGFFLPLTGLRSSVHFVSYALPVTYGIQALRDIMLAGRDPELVALLPMAGLGIGFYCLCTLIYTWQHKKE